MNIPFAPDAEKFSPLKRCLQKTAQKAVVTDYFAALLLSHFWEAVCDEISQGNVVVVPGLGCFAPTLWSPRKKRGTVLPKVLPGFSAARPFKNQTELCCSIERARAGHAYLLRYRRNHHLGSSSTSCASRPFAAMQAFRERLTAQMKKIGLESYDPYD